MLRAYCTIALGMLLFVLGSQSLPAESLDGNAVRTLIADSTFDYRQRRQGITYQGTISFTADGAVSYKDAIGLADRGKWTVEENRLCLVLKKTKSNSCYAVARSGMVSYSLGDGYQISHHVASKTKMAQSVLAKLGQNVGKVDGAWGRTSRNALNAFRESLGLPATNSLSPDMVLLLQVIDLGGERGLIPADDAIGGTQVRSNGAAVYLAENGKKVLQLASGRQTAAKWWKTENGGLCEHVPSLKRDICAGDDDYPWIGYRLGNHWLYLSKDGKTHFTVTVETGDTLAKHKATAVSGTTGDIIAAIRKQELANPKLFQSKLRAAKRKAPGRGSSRKLMQFYLDRGDAHTEIGQHLAARKDYEKAATYARKARAQELDQVLINLAVTHALSDPTGGAFIRGLQAAQKAARNDGWRIALTAVLATNAYAYGYEGIGAKNLRLAQALERKLRKKRWWPKYGPSSYARLYRAKYARGYMTGQYAKAETELRRAISNGRKSLRILNRPIDHHFLYGLKVDRGHLLKLQGRYTEAEIALKEALLEYIARYGRYTWRTVRGMYHLISVLVQAGRNDEAVRLANLTIDTADEISMNPSSSVFQLVRVSLAEAKLNTGDIAGAQAEFTKIEDAIKGNRGAEIFWLLDRSDYLVIKALGDDPARAAQLSAEALERATKVEKENHLIRAAHAIALARSGKSEAAYKEFQKIIPILASFDLGDDENVVGSAKEKRIRLVLETYMDFLAGLAGTEIEKALGIDAVAEAFRVADAARASSVQRALSASSARARVSDDKLAGLVREQQDIAKRLAALKGLLSKGLSRPTGEQNKKSLASLRKQITKLGTEQKTLTRRVTKQFPGYAEMINPRPPTVAELQAKLREGEAYLSIYVTRDKTFIWAVPQSGRMVFATAKIGETRMGELVQLLRDALNPSASSLLGIPDFDLQVGHQLYSNILMPVEAVLSASRSLLVSTNGALGELPLSVLPTKQVKQVNKDGALFAGYRDVPWLAKTHALTMVPSAASLITLRSQPPGNGKRAPFIGFGDPRFSAKKVADAARGDVATRGMPIKLRAAPDTEGIDAPGLAALPRLPDTAAEVRAIALSLSADPSKAVITGSKASEAFVKEADLSGYKVVAFATHGLIPGELRGLSEPALALSAPSLTKSKGDGLLTMSEILQLKLDADWVVLSACNTGSSRGNGAEAVSGLGRAFFFAGTRALLVSSWPVETTSARLLTTDVFARQTKTEGITRAEALRQSMVALTDTAGLKDPDTGKPVFYYAHPIFWAPFILVGDGGAAGAG